MQPILSITVVVAIGLFVLLVPGMLRTLLPGSGLTRLVDHVAGLVALPSRLLGALHTGDVRMHLAWMIVGAALLVLTALALAD